MTSLATLTSFRDRSASYLGGFESGGTARASFSPRTEAAAVPHISTLYVSDERYHGEVLNHLFRQYFPVARAALGDILRPANLRRSGGRS